MPVKQTKQAKPKRTPKKEEIPSFSDVYPRETKFKGEQMRAADLVDTEFIIQEYRLFPSKFGEGNYAIIGIKKSGKNAYFSTGSEVVLDQLDRVGDRLPIKTTLRKKGKYFKLE